MSSLQPESSLPLNTNGPRESATVARSPADPIAAADVVRQIDDEFADHLACVATEHAAERDLPADAAAKQALADFGDVRRAWRRCWWINRGDEIMRRAVMIGAVVLGFALVAAIWFPAAASLSNLGDRVSEMTSKVDELNATQRAMLEQQQALAKPLVISGAVYLGDKSQAASGVEVEVWRIADRELARTVTTNDRGQFVVRSLPAGQYLLITSLIGPQNPRIPHDGEEMRYGAMFRTQSPPVNLGSNHPTAHVEFDAQFRSGEVSLAVSGQFPDTLPATADSPGARVFLVWTCDPVALRTLPAWVDFGDAPEKELAPMQGYQCGWVRNKAFTNSQFATHQRLRFELYPLGPRTNEQGTEQDGHMILLTPHQGERDLDVFSLPDPRMPAGPYATSARMVAVATSPNGANLNATIAEPKAGATQVIDVLSGKQTRLLANIPDDVAAKLRQALAASPPPEFGRSRYAEIPLAVEVVGADVIAPPSVGK